MTCSIAMNLEKKGGAIFNTEIIPQNHFSCMIEIEKESKDEPGMMTENSSDNMLKESFWHTKIFSSMKGGKSQFMNAFHQCLSKLIGRKKKTKTDRSIFLLL